MRTVSKRDTRGHVYLGQTRSTCPECLEIVNAKILARDGQIFFHKLCPEHGHSEALISEDAEYYVNALTYAKPGSIPHRFASRTDKGCPHDCGLCPDHEQHCCHPIVEVTDVCNLDCPICIASNGQSGFMSVEEFGRRVDALIAAEGSLENITLSGGEPTLHPQFWELVAAANRPEVLRTSVVTNGLALTDIEFCRRLADENVYVILQWDGFDDEVYTKLRGRPLLELKQQALANLEACNAPTQLLCVAARGVNEGQLGQVVELMLSKDFILSLVVQPLAFSGAGSSFPGDPMDRLTIEGTIRALADQCSGVLRTDDFFPLPCPNPHCVSLTYLLCLDDGTYLPFPRFTDMKKHLHLLSQSATIGPNEETESSIHEIVNDLWSTAGEIPDSERVSKALRRAVLQMFDSAVCDERERVRISERQAKSIFIHHYMDRFNFDLSRVIKCCHHYPKSGGRSMPICTYNLFYRDGEANEFAG